MNNMVNMNSSDGLVPKQVRDLLICAGCPLDEHAEAKLRQHLVLVRQWNVYASLVSNRNLEMLSEVHLVDSLSLVPIIMRLQRARGTLLDIGTGGGFPAIPLRVAIPTLEVVMVERSQKKVAFLQKVLAALALDRARVVHGSFPEAVPGIRPDLITARAIETPGKLLPNIVTAIEERGIFLCQTPPSKLEIPREFHVERVQDPWTEAQLRRGDLYLISRFELRIMDS